MEKRMKMGAALAFWLVCGIGLVSTGCVMKEQYEAEKTRALNFQRLLAQEEKRTGELDAEAKRLQLPLPPPAIHSAVPARGPVPDERMRLQGSAGSPHENPFPPRYTCIPSRGHGRGYYDS